MNGGRSFRKIAVIAVMAALFFGTIYVSSVYLGRPIPLWVLAIMLAGVGLLAAITVMKRTVWLQQTVLLFYVIAPFLCLLWGIVLLWNRYVFPSDLLLLAVFYTLTMLGVGIGYHRMLTHQGFETTAPVRIFWLIMGVMAFNGTPIFWTATHIKHHAHSDEEDDPHSPLHGFWHAHFGWLFSLYKNEVQAKTYAPHLLEDRQVVFVDSTAGIWMLLSLLIPFLIGGWTGLLWGGAVRIFLMNHVGWSTNSICHCFGARAFNTSDESRNNWVLAMLDFGEGWHNNHHAFPRSAFHGLRWWQFDLSGLVIGMMESVGLVWNVQRVTEEAITAKQLQGDTMEEVIGDLRLQLKIKIAAAKEEFEGLLARLPRGPDLTPVHAMGEQAKKRLDEIQAFVSRASHMKKQKIAAYVREVQTLAEQLRQNVKETAARYNLRPE